MRKIRKCILSINQDDYNSFLRHFFYFQVRILYFDSLMTSSSISALDFFGGILSDENFKLVLKKTLYAVCMR